MAWDCRSSCPAIYTLTVSFPAGIAVCIGMASTFAYANSTLREQVALKVNTTSYSLTFPSNVALCIQNNVYVEPSFAM